MVDRTSGDRFANYKDLLNEIRLFTSCPELLKPLDDSQDEHRPQSTGSDKEDDQRISEHDEETNDYDDEDLTNEDDELTRQLDNELSKQLDSQFSNILVGNGSSLHDSESLVSDKFSSVFSSDEDEEDDLDRIVEQLQSKSSSEEAKSSMPTLSCLLTCSPSSVSTDEPQSAQQTTDRPTVAGKNKSKIAKKKVKFVKHQSKIKYAFSEDESLLNLFNKIVKNNFHPNTNSKFNSGGGGNDKLTQFTSNKLSIEPLSTDRELDSVSVDGSISGNSSVSSSVFSSASRRKIKDAIRTNKSHSSKHHNSAKKPKSEIFTLLNSSTTNSALENLFSSLRSK